VRSPRTRHWRREKSLPYLLLAPALVLLAGMVYPFGLGLYYSFTSYWLQYPNRFRFVWFDNYLSLIEEPRRSSSRSGWGSRWRCSCMGASPGAA